MGGGGGTSGRSVSKKEAFDVPSVPVSVAVVAAVTLMAEALKTAETDPAGTVTEAGTATEGLTEASATV